MSNTIDSIWTRGRVESYAATHSTFKVFPTQEKLLSFLGNERLKLDNIDKWIPFSIEFMSEAELHELTVASMGASSTPSIASTPQGQVSAFFTRKEQERPELGGSSIFSKRKGPLDAMLSLAEEPKVGSKRARDAAQTRGGSPPARSPSPAQPTSPGPQIPTDGGTVVAQQQHAPNQPQRTLFSLATVVHEAGPIQQSKSNATSVHGPTNTLPSSGNYFLGVGTSQATKHSTQSKFFAAMTTEGLKRYLECVPYPQQHLFELILLTNPCRVYFDIERDADQSSHDIRRLAELSNDATSSSKSVSDGQSNSTASERVDEARYLRAYLRDMGAGRAPTCPYGCDHCVPSRDIDFVVSVLLKYWRMYLDAKRPELGLGNCLPDDGYEGHASSRAQRSFTFSPSGIVVGTSQDSAALMGQQITVLQSIPLRKSEADSAKQSSKKPKASKFSIHVVFKFVEDANKKSDALSSEDDEPELLESPDRRPRHSYRRPEEPQLREVVLNSNASVGDLVLGFVAYLYEVMASLQKTLLAHDLAALEGEKAAKRKPHGDIAALRQQYQELHASLFYHGEVTDTIRLSKEAGAIVNNQPAMPSVATFNEDVDCQQAPRLQLKCLIDTAVYSKNRMMRCMGSSKLGKMAVLLPYNSPYTGHGRGLFGGPEKWWELESFKGPATNVKPALLVHQANLTSPSSFDIQQEQCGAPKEGDHLPATLSAAFFGSMVSLHHMSDAATVARLVRIEDRRKPDQPIAGRLLTQNQPRLARDSHTLVQPTLASLGHRKAVSRTVSAEEALWRGGGGFADNDSPTTVGDLFAFGSYMDRPPGDPLVNRAEDSLSRDLLCDTYPKGRTVIIVPNGMSFADWGHKGGHRVHLQHSLGGGGGGGSGRDRVRATSVSTYESGIQVRGSGPTSLPVLDEMIIGLSTLHKSKGGGHLPRIYNHLLYFNDNAALATDEVKPKSESEAGEPTKQLKDMHLGAMVITVTGHRYCRNVKRAHKSNDVYYTVFLEWAVETKQVPNTFGPTRSLASGPTPKLETSEESSLVPSKNTTATSAGLAATPKRTLFVFSSSSPTTGETANQGGGGGAAYGGLAEGSSGRLRPQSLSLGSGSLLAVSANLQHATLSTPPPQPATELLSENSDAVARYQKLAALQQPPVASNSVHTMLLQSRQTKVFGKTGAGSPPSKTTYHLVDPHPPNICAKIQELQGKRLSQTDSRAADNIDADDPFDVDASSSISTRSASTSSTTTTSSSTSSAESDQPRAPRHIPVATQRSQAAPHPPTKVKLKVRYTTTQAAPPPSPLSQSMPFHMMPTQAPSEAIPLPVPPSSQPVSHPTLSTTSATTEPPHSKAQMHFAASSTGPGLGMAVATSYTSVTRLVLVGVQCFQKCHDPECNQVAGQRRSYRSEPLEVPIAIWPLLEKWAIGLANGGTKE